MKKRKKSRKGFLVSHKMSEDWEHKWESLEESLPEGLEWDVIRRGHGDREGPPVAFIV